MDWAIETARAEGAPAIYLSVWEHGARAIAFYARHGFATVGEAPFRARHADLSGSGDEARPVTRRGDPRRRAGRPAARLSRPEGRRLDRRLRRPQCRLGLGRRPRRDRRESPPRGRGGGAGRGWSRSTRSIRPTPSMPTRPGPTTPAPMPTRSSPTGPASRSASSPPIARPSCSPTARPA